MFENMKLAVKLIGGFCLVLFLFICVMGIYHYAIKTTTTNFSNLMQIDVAISSHAARAEVLMQQCRVAEKNFLTKLDLTYQDIMEQNVKSIIAEANSISILAKQANNEKGVQKAGDISKNIMVYHENFQQLVAAYQKKGLDAKTGIRGEFKKIVDRFMEGMTQHEVDGYYINLLQLVRYENEFLITKHERTSALILKTLDELIELTKEKNISPVKKIITDAFTILIPEYRKAFLELRDEAEHAGPDSKSYLKMKSTRQEAGEMVAASYFRGGKEMALEIRLYEKEYLISGDTQYSAAALLAVDRLIEAFEKSTVNKDFSKEAIRNLKSYKKEFNTLVEVDQKITELLLRMQNSVLLIEPLITELYETARNDSLIKEKKVASQVKSRANLASAIGLIAILLGIFLSIIITRGITRPIVDAVNFAKTIQQGDLSKRMNKQSTNELGQLAGALDNMADSLQENEEEIRRNMLNLEKVVANVTNSAEHINTGANQVVSSSAALSHGASEQASSLEEITSSMAQIGSRTKTNAANASQANELAISARKAAKDGSEQMEKMIQSMQAISDSSREIEKIIKAIDSIAFQTNLLALNAAVEAARAGKHGKGFAVVAQEVRSLAARSAKAAQETTNLIETANNKVKDGNAVAQKTSEALSEINDGVTKVSDLVAEIAAASNEQAQEISRVNQSLTQIDGVTQRNAANVKEMSASAMDLLSQVTDIRNILKEFRNENHEAADIGQAEVLLINDYQLAALPEKT